MKRGLVIFLTAGATALAQLFANPTVATAFRGAGKVIGR